NLTYTEILARNLKVMDAAAISLARDNALPVLVFSLHEEGGLAAALTGEGRYTLITEGESND
ncbi:MAG: UMP kinase, partial [Alphaproteobacteria bacterium]|nr:UMP kinase [Alphaproteobacteria bacterium]